MFLAEMETLAQLDLRDSRDHGYGVKPCVCVCVCVREREREREREYVCACV